MFLSPVRSVAESFPDQGSFVTLGSAWPGRAQYEVEFANGTTVRKPVVAKVSTDFSYSSGRSLLNDVCLVAGPSDVLSPSDTSKGSPNATNPSPSYYPKPVRRDNYNLISGYYLDESNLQDVAVLAIPSFDPSEYKSEPVEFARVATEFVTQAAKDGKKKLVIDLSGNPGGQINSGMDLFKMFFPDKDIYQASRMRSHKALNLAGEALAPLNLTNVDDLKLCANSSGLCLEATVKPDQAPANVSHFESWQQIYGPYEQLGGNMTALMGVEWLDAFAEISGPIRGYGGIPQIPKKRLFEPENILLVRGHRHKAGPLGGSANKPNQTVD